MSVSWSCKVYCGLCSGAASRGNLRRLDHVCSVFGEEELLRPDSLQRISNKNNSQQRWHAAAAVCCIGSLAGGVLFDGVAVAMNNVVSNAFKANNGWYVMLQL